MRESLQRYMRVGIVHFMAYPETLTGDGPIVETIRRIAEDEFFSAVEVTTIKDPKAREAGHPAYGDQHSRFGLEGSENDVPQVVEFLRELFQIGYLGEGKRPIVGFEVKPLPGESSEMVIAESKRTLLEAWSRL